VSSALHCSSNLIKHYWFLEFQCHGLPFRHSFANCSRLIRFYKWNCWKHVPANLKQLWKDHRLLLTTFGIDSQCFDGGHTIDISSNSFLKGRFGYSCWWFQVTLWFCCLVREESFELLIGLFRSWCVRNCYSDSKPGLLSNLNFPDPLSLVDWGKIWWEDFCMIENCHSFWISREPNSETEVETGRFALHACSVIFLRTLVRSRTFFVDDWNSISDSHSSSFDDQVQLHLLHWHLNTECVNH